MVETYFGDDGLEHCDSCDLLNADCTCVCIVCGDGVVECACDEGPTYPA